MRQIEAFLISVDQGKNRFRWYQVVTMLNHNGGTIVTSWGRLGEMPKGSKVNHCGGEQDALQKHQQVVLQKRKSGYIEVPK